MTRLSRRSCRVAASRRRVLAALSLAALSLISVTFVATTTTGAAPRTSSPGCGTASPGTTVLTPTVNGHQRTVIVHVPLGSTNTTAHALVLNLHGSGATALDQEAFSGMNFASNADDYVVAYPQGLIPYDGGFVWNVPNEPLVSGQAVPKGSPSDVTFLTSLVGLLEAKYCINPSEVYATGFSGGARMASQLACDSSGVFAAVAPVSGLRRPTPCKTKRAVSIIAFHGSADPVDPFAGHGLPYWSYSVARAAQDWAKQDKCASKPSTAKDGSSLVVTSYAKCAGGAAVVLYEVKGEGHEWPGGPTMPASLVAELGPQSSAVSADAVMWTFFQAHSLT